MPTFPFSRMPNYPKIDSRVAGRNQRARNYGSGVFNERGLKGQLFKVSAEGAGQ